MFDKQFVHGLCVRENNYSGDAILENLDVDVNTLHEYFKRGHSFKGHKILTKKIIEWELRLDIKEGHVDASLTDIEELRRVLLDIEKGFSYRSELASKLSLSMQQYTLLMTSKRHIPYNVITPVRYKVTQFINDNESFNVLTIDEMWDNVKVIGQHTQKETVITALGTLTKIKPDVLVKALESKEAFISHLSKPQRIRLHKMVTNIKFQQGMKQFSMGRTANEIANKVVEKLTQKE